MHQKAGRRIVLLPGIVLCIRCIGYLAARRGAVTQLTVHVWPGLFGEHHDDDINEEPTHTLP